MKDSYLQIQNLQFNSDCETTISIKLTCIRDGTQGISLSTSDRLLAEWQDSGAFSLAINENLDIDICGIAGEHRYLLRMPGKPLNGKLVSDTEAVITFQM